MTKWSQHGFNNNLKSPKISTHTSKNRHLGVVLGGWERPGGSWGVWEHLGGVMGPYWGRLESVLGDLGAILGRLLAVLGRLVASLACIKPPSGRPKTICFLMFFNTFAFRSFPEANLAQHGVFHRPGAISAASWRHLGASWPRLGAILGRLGPSCGRLGASCGQLGVPEATERQTKKHYFSLFFSILSRSEAFL